MLVLQGSLIDTYGRSESVARHVLHIQRGHVKPPGPKADKRRL